MGYIDEVTGSFVFDLPRRGHIVAPPEPLFTKATLDAEIRLREIALKEKEMEVRRLEALAKLETARKENRND